MKAARNRPERAAAGQQLRRQVESGAWYLVRWPDGRYDLQQVMAPIAQSSMGTRAMRVSPFPGDGDAMYFADCDTATAPMHNTAWIARSTLAAALGGTH